MIDRGRGRSHRLLPLLLLATAACGTRLVMPLPPPPAAVAYAWVTFDARTIRASDASGMADRIAARRLTIDDPVRVASISKLVVALAVMRLVENGRVDLDADVSERLGWRLRNPAFPDVPITLRLLLSHRSSLRDEVDYVVPLGKTIRSVVDDAKAFDAAHAPGTYFRYSNLNYPVIATVLERASGERFDRLMRSVVLEPLGLDACFNWSRCSDASIARAVVLYDDKGAVLRDDLGGVRPACPVMSVDAACDLAVYALGTNGAIFSPQGGLRASTHDLSVIGQMLLNRGRHRGARFLSKASIDMLARPAWTFDGTNGDASGGFYCGYGLATQVLPTRVAGCRDDVFGDGRAVTGHAGDAYGVRSGLWIDAKRGVGIAYFATNNGAEPARGRSSYRAVEEWLASRIKAPR